ncbi:MAG TPA: dynamin family protein [Burkholderiaceae bacterium]|nr:dynamin family protein [Burkholderiaceae bacterium]
MEADLSASVLNADARNEVFSPARPTSTRKHDPPADASASCQAAAVTAPGEAPTRLAQCLDAAMSLHGVDLEACRRLKARLAEGVFNLVVAGEFNRGKSSVINALLGAAVLPVGVVPLTSVVTVVRQGERPRATVCFAGGATREIGIESIAEFITEKGNPRNAKGVDQVVVAYPSAWLRDGVRLIDTPGIGSIHRHNTDAALRFLP